MQPAFILSCAAVLLLAASPGVSGFWRTLCHGTLGVAQIDPVVNFGQVSPHAHFIAGASSESPSNGRIKYLQVNSFQTSASSVIQQTS